MRITLGFGNNPESQIELVRYNLMCRWRKVVGNPRLCMYDMSKSEKKLFAEELESIVEDECRLIEMGFNPFEDNVNVILMKLGILR